MSIEHNFYETPSLFKKGKKNGMERLNMKYVLYVIKKCITRHEYAFDFYQTLQTSIRCI